MGAQAENSGDISLLKEIGELKADVSGLRSELSGIHKLLHEAVLTQQRDNSKRLREIDDRVRKVEMTLAEGSGKNAGSKAMLAMIMSIIGAFSGCAGAVISKFF